MRIGILTDIHENTAALTEALRLASFHKCDELACLGDIVGYDTRFYNHSVTRSAKTCLNLIKTNCRWIAAGNHDLHAARRFPSYSNGFEYPQNWFSMNSAERKKSASGKIWCYESEADNDLNEGDIDFMQNLQEFIITKEIHTAFLLSHYIFPDFTGSTTVYIERNRQLKSHWEFMASNGTRFSFIGHSHNTFAGFAYQDNRSFMLAFHSLPNDSFSLNNEPIVVLLPPLSGEKGRTGFTIIDTLEMKLSIVPTGI